MVDIRRKVSLVLLMMAVALSSISSTAMITKHQAIVPAQGLVYSTSQSAPPIIEDGYINTNAATGTTCPSGSYSKVTTTISAYSFVPASASSASCERGYFEFDTHLIPSGAHITQVNLVVTRYSSSSCSPIDWRGSTEDAATDTAAGVWAAIGAGTLYLTGDLSACLGPSANLGPVAAQDLQASLGVGHFTIGFKQTSEIRTSSSAANAFRTSEYTSPSSRPQLQIEYYTTTVSPETSTVYIGYRSSSGLYALQSPKYKEWYPQTDTFSPEVELPNQGADIQYVKVLKNPISSVIVLLSYATNGNLELFSCISTCSDKFNWHDEGLVAQLPVPLRPQYKYFDAAFEEDPFDTDLLIVYAKASVAPYDFYYRTWIGGSFSSETGYSFNGGTPRQEDIPYFKLAVQPATANMALIIQDSTRSAAYTFTWDDTVIANEHAMTGTVHPFAADGNCFVGTPCSTGVLVQAVDIAFEHASGAVVAEIGTPHGMVWQRYNGTWGTSNLVTGQGVFDSSPVGFSGWNRAVPDPEPTSNKVMMCYLLGVVPFDMVTYDECIQEDGGTTLAAPGHSQGSWGVSNANAPPPTQERPFDFAYNPANGNGTFYYTLGSPTNGIGIQTYTWTQASAFQLGATIVQPLNTYPGFVDAITNGNGRAGEAIKQVVVNNQFAVNNVVPGAHHPIYLTYLDFNNNQNTFVPMTLSTNDTVAGDTGIESAGPSNYLTMGEYMSAIFDPTYPVPGGGGPPPPPPPPPGSVNIPISLNTLPGSDTPQTAGVAFTVTCTGGGGTHNGNPVTQTFVCNPNTTVTVTTPADTGTSHFRFSDGSTLRTFTSCSTATCAGVSYDIRRQFSLTITPVGMPSTTQAQVAIFRNGVPAFPFFPGSSTSTQFVDESTLANVTALTIVVSDQERYKTYNSTSSRTILMSAPETRSYLYVHEFFIDFRTIEESEGAQLSIVPPAVFTSTITSANGTVFPVTMSTQDGLHAFDSTASVWVRNGTQTFGDVSWRSLKVQNAGTTCSVLTFHTCDVLSFSKYFGLPNFSYVRMGTANSTIVLGNVTYDNPNNILRFNSTASGTQITKLEFLTTDHTGVSVVKVNDVPVNWTLGQIVNTNIMVLNIPNIGFTGQNRFEIDFGNVNLSPNNIVIPPGSQGTLWKYNLTRAFDDPVTNQSTINFSFLSTTMPYNATVLITDSWLTSEQQYTEYFNCPPPAITPCKGVLNANGTTLVQRVFPNTQTIFFFVYDDKGIVRITAQSPGQTHSAITGFESFNLFGVPVVALFPILISVIGPKSLAPIFMPITAAVIGLMAFYGLITIPDTVAGILGLVAAMGILLGLRR